MLALRKVAVTGGLASGKTSVCNFFKSCGAYVVSADEIVHQLLSPDTALGQKILSELGPEILTDHYFDRTKIAQRVFSNPQQLQILEELLHPAVLHEIELLYEKIKVHKDYTLFVAEIPLLYESKGAGFFDAVIAVIADPILCKKRFEQKTGCSNDEYEKRMLRQLSPEYKASQASYTIVNNGDLEDLKNAVINLYALISV